MDGFLEEEEVGDDDGIPEDGDRELLELLVFGLIWSLTKGRDGPWVEGDEMDLELTGAMGKPSDQSPELMPFT